MPEPTADPNPQIAAPPPRARSLTARLTLVAALGALPILLLAGSVLLWLFADRIERRFDTFLAAHQQQLIAAAEIAGDGALRLTARPADPHFDLPFSGWYWQVRGPDRVLAQSPSAGPLEGGGLDALALPGVDGAADLIGPGATKLRGVARDVRLPGAAESFRFVVAGPHAEIDSEVLEFGVQLAVALGALGLAFLAATRAAGALWPASAAGAARGAAGHPAWCRAAPGRRVSRRSIAAGRGTERGAGPQ